MLRFFLFIVIGYDSPIFFTCQWNSYFFYFPGAVWASTGLPLDTKNRFLKNYPDFLLTLTSTISILRI